MWVAYHVCIGVCVVEWEWMWNVWKCHYDTCVVLVSLCNNSKEHNESKSENNENFSISTIKTYNSK